jgi:hypothetical protein
MASWFKESQRGEIIGTPCFGSVSGTNGNPASVFLKHSGLPISISTLILRPENVQNQKTGDILMDKEIKLTLKDIKTGKDSFRSRFIKD